jgi:deferrochelatase/peroxidase EfeB
LVVIGIRRAISGCALVTLLAAVCVVLGPAAPASAHTVSGVGATNFRTTLSALTPAVQGIHLRVIENGSRLELRNDTATDVVVAGYSGEPYARVGPAGVFVNDNSPATYLNVDRYSTTPVPAGVDGKSAPIWRRVSTDPVWRWHDHRVHWMLKSLPPVVAADPGSEHRISNWTVVLEQNGQRLTATGSLDWVPGPSPLPWVALAALVALAVAALAYLARPHRFLALATAFMVTVDIAHRVGVMAIITDSVAARLGALFGGDALLVWPFAVFGALSLWHRHTRAAWLSAVAAGLTVVSLAIDDVPALWRSSAPTVLPATMERAVVAVVLGLGVGLILALPLMLTRHASPSRPWTPSAPKGATPPRPALVSQAAIRAGSGPGAEAAEAVTPSDGLEELAEPDRELAEPDQVGLGRRKVAGLLAAGALGALAGAGAGASVSRSRGSTTTAPPTGTPLADVGARTVAFHGDRQGGIATPGRPQAHVWLGGFDLAPEVGPAALRDLLRRWTDAAAKLTAGQALGAADDAVVADAGPAALTVTVGFGPSLFGQAGIPLSARPAALAPLPAFAGETLDPARGDGDLGVVVAGDNAVVVAHAARVLRRLGAGVVGTRWQTTGFNAARGTGPDTATPRNLMGQLDGTNNPQPTDPDFDARVFVPPQADPAWLRGGSYLVFRRIRMLLDQWDGLAVADQERVIGRRRDTGAALSGGGEHTPANYGARLTSGALAIPDTAHIRLATPAFNRGAAMLRRGFSYVDGDESGLLFLAWQADPRHGFIPVQQHLIGVDALGRFIRHEASALFAMPGGVARGGYLGQSFLEAM